MKERVHLERELVKQQQQNLILQKQREIDRLEAQADRHLFQQGYASSSKPAHKEKLAVVQEEPATPSPEATVVFGLGQLGAADLAPPIRRGQLGAANSATGQFGAGPTRRGRFGAGTFRRGVCNGDINFQCNFVCISPVML